MRTRTYPAHRPRPALLLLCSVAVAVALLGGAVHVAASTAAPDRSHRSATAMASERTVLGAHAFAPNGRGFGRARPRIIFNGGDPSGYVDHIHWHSWGHRVAKARGLNAIFRPGGGYYSRRVWIKLRASHLGRCHPGGPRAYRHLSYRAPSRPGGRLGRWHTWSGQPSLCHWR